MSRTRLLIGGGIVGLVSLMAVAAVAEDPRGERGWRGGGHHGGWHHGYRHGDEDGGMRGHGWQGKGMMRRIIRLDADRDGRVTLEEFLAPHEARFAARDGDGDGRLSPDEVVKRQLDAVDYRVRRMLKTFDTDGDGKITKEEFAAPARKRFAERDFNGDGQISGDELPPRAKPGGGWRGKDGARGRGGEDDAAELGGPEGEEERGEARGEGRPMDRDEGGRGEGRRHGEGRYGRHHEGYGRHHRGPHHGGRGWGMERSLEKVLERSARRFAAMDANNDGVIDASDIAAPSQEGIDFARKQRLHVLDTDKDGWISKEEFLAKARERFTQADLDGDGAVTAADLPPRAAKRWEKMAGKAAKRGGDGAGGSGGAN